MRGVERDTGGNQGEEGGGFEGAMAANVRIVHALWLHCLQEPLRPCVRILTDSLNLIPGLSHRARLDYRRPAFGDWRPACGMRHAACGITMELADVKSWTV